MPSGKTSTETEPVDVEASQHYVLVQFCPSGDDLDIKVTGYGVGEDTDRITELLELTVEQLRTEQTTQSAQIVTVP